MDRDARPPLDSGGSEPMAVTAGDYSGNGIPDLRVTNAGGQIATLPGIGSDAHGTGFFSNVVTAVSDPGANIIQAVVDPTTGLEFLLGADGSLDAFNGATFIALVGAGSGIDAVSPTDGLLAVGFNDGSIGLLSETMADCSGTCRPSSPTSPALQALQAGGDVDVFVAYSGREVPVFYSFALAVVVELPPAPPVTSPTSVEGADLLLVSTLLSGGQPATGGNDAAQATTSGETLALFFADAATRQIAPRCRWPRCTGRATRARAGAETGRGVGEEMGTVPPARPTSSASRRACVAGRKTPGCRTGWRISSTRCTNHSPHGWKRRSPRRSPLTTRVREAESYLGAQELSREIRD